MIGAGTIADRARTIARPGRAATTRPSCRVVFELSRTPSCNSGRERQCRSTLGVSRSPEAIDMVGAATAGASRRRHFIAPLQTEAATASLMV